MLGPALVSPWFTRLCAGVVLAALLLPPHGLGIPMCLLDATTGIPCPGCGLTRSVTCIGHLRFADAWGYHPFGFLVFAVALLAGITNLVPSATRSRLAVWLGRHDRVLRAMTLVAVVMFVAFGTARAVANVISADLFSSL